MRIKRILLLILIGMVSLVFISCNKQNTPGTTKEPQNTPSETKEVTTTKEPEETPEPTESLPKLDESQLGKPQEDAIVVFEDNFEDGQYSPEAIVRYQKYYGIIDDRLYLSYIGTTDEWFDAAQTYAPGVYCDFDETISQYEYHITFQTSYPDSRQEVWMGCIVGIRVYEPGGEDYKPSDLDSGLYLSVTESNELVLYHGVPAHWPKGACKINVPVSFKETHKLTIVDANGLVYYYADDELFMHVDMVGDELIVYDGEGNEIYKAANNLKDQTGVLKLFNHFAKTIVDEVVIKYR
jgi:hypothetical protein